METAQLKLSMTKPMSKHNRGTPVPLLGVPENRNVQDMTVASARASEREREREIVSQKNAAQKEDTLSEVERYATLL
jgi:hypothetical protein